MTDDLDLLLGYGRGVTRKERKQNDTEHRVLGFKEQIAEEYVNSVTSTYRHAMQGMAALDRERHIQAGNDPALHMLLATMQGDCNDLVRRSIRRLFLGR